MNRLIFFLSHTRLWILPVGFLWLFLLGVQLDAGFLRFETVDARYYRELAGDFVSGRPMVLDGLVNEKGNSFSPYPPGFPVLLGIFSLLGGSGFDWPVHIMLHAFLGFLLLVLWQENLSLLPLAVLFFTDTVLILAASSISEFSFIVFSIMAVMSFTRLQFHQHPKWQILLLLSASATISIRYSAVFLIPFMLYKWMIFKLDGSERAKVVSLPVVYFLLVCCFLFGLQFADSGLATGGDRYPNSDSAIFLIMSLTEGLWNQVFILRDFSGASFLSFLSGAALMVIFVSMLFIPVSISSVPVLSRQDENHPAFKEALYKNLLLAGGCYLLFIIPLRWYFYFAEGYDNRLLAPGACLIGLAFLVRKEEELLRLPLVVKLAYLLIASAFFIPWKELIPG